MKKDYIAPEINIIHFKNGDVMMSSNGSHSCDNDTTSDTPCSIDSVSCPVDTICLPHSEGCNEDVNCPYDVYCPYEGVTT